MVPAAMAMALGLGPAPTSPGVDFSNRGAHAGMNPCGGSEAIPYPADSDQLLNLLVPEWPVGTRTSMVVVEIPTGWALVCAHAPGASIVSPPLTDAVTGWEWTIEHALGDQPARIRWTRTDVTGLGLAIWFPFTVRTPRGVSGSFAFRVYQRYELGPDEVPGREGAAGQINWVDPPTCGPAGDTAGPHARCPHPAPRRFVAEGRWPWMPMGERDRWIPVSATSLCCRGEPTIR
jgi:hypothetical protein